MKRIAWIVMVLALGACDSEDGGDAGPRVTGCAEMGGPMCPDGTMCCSGVPYPTEGECNPSCGAISDRHAKEGFAPVDADAVLARLSDLEVSRWTYRADPEHARHVGPMAQDFHAAFGIGSDETMISQVDADGVLMVSVQALNRRLEALEQDNAALRAHNVALESRLRRLESR